MGSTLEPPRDEAPARGRAAPLDRSYSSSSGTGGMIADRPWGALSDRVASALGVVAAWAAIAA